MAKECGKKPDMPLDERFVAITSEIMSLQSQRDDLDRLSNELMLRNGDLADDNEHLNRRNQDLWNENVRAANAINKMFWCVFGGIIGGLLLGFGIGAGIGKFIL